MMSKYCGETKSSWKKNAFEDLPAVLNREINKILEENSFSKVTYLFKDVLPHISDMVTCKDLLNLRLVSRFWKLVVDEHWISPDVPKGFGISQLPAIYLQNQRKVNQFKRSMGRFRNPIPFELRVGIGIFPGDFLNIRIWDELLIELYWTEFYECTKRIGKLITGILLDIRMPEDASWSLVEKVMRLVMNSLKEMPNLTFLGMHLSTARLESAFAKYYRLLQVKGKYNNHKTFPVLRSLTTLEIMTIGLYRSHGGNTVKIPVTFPWRFCLEHGSSLKNLRLFGNLSELKTMGRIQARNLERLSFEIHHCGRALEENALAALPKIRANKETLRRITVSLSWTWRACDVVAFLQWLEVNCPGEDGYCLETLMLTTYINPLQFCKIKSSEDSEGECSCSEDDADSHCIYGILDNGSVNGLVPVEEDDEGNKVEMCQISALSLPRTRKIVMCSEYKGSYQWLRAFPKESVEQLELYYCLEDPHLTYQTGFMNALLQNPEVKPDAATGKEEKKNCATEDVVWTYFPKLNALFLVWPELVEDEPWLWLITRESFEQYLRESQRKKAAGGGEGISSSSKHDGTLPKETLLGD